ncbi:hypothetical protein [Methylobacterium sp. sgz302541]
MDIFGWFYDAWMSLEILPPNKSDVLETIQTDLILNAAKPR